MESYTEFSHVYDMLMDNVPYDAWCEYIISLLKEQGIENGLLAELGCGTGNITVRLHDAGYDMIGIDNSEDMLLEAREKSSLDILYLQQDMQDMELFGTVRAFVSVCDSMNYLLEPMEMKETFRKVNNYLDEGGIFIFDLKTEYFFKNILGNQTIAENRDEVSFIWENEYDAQTKENAYLLTLFIQDEEDNEVYYKCEEEHVQRAYATEEVETLLAEAGMELVAMYDAFTKEPPREDSQRIYVVARETFQEGKTYKK